MQYAAVRGHGDPNEPDMGNTEGRLCCSVRDFWAIKMSYKGSRKVDGFFSTRRSAAGGLR